MPLNDHIKNNFSFNLVYYFRILLIIVIDLLGLSPASEGGILYSLPKGLGKDKRKFSKNKE